MQAAKKREWLHRAAAVAALAPLGATAQTAPTVGDDLSRLSLEELADVRISSVSRRPERLADAAAAVYVITHEDIARSGYQTLPDILRLAPNLVVARQDDSTYSISARGFNSTTANKLLVLIDGRSIYTPLYSGVFWDAADTSIEDIERIEVISGPGGTLWGANAVNGVINVITRSARDSQGGLVAAQLGTDDRRALARWGGQTRGDASYRVYAKTFQRDDSDRPNGSSARDDIRRTQAGFRVDGGQAENGYTVQGDAYNSSIDEPVRTRKSASGANLLGRWNRASPGGGNVQAQAYCDHSERDYPGTFAESLDTLDVDVQHSFQWREGHEVLWGGGTRYSRDRVDNSAALAFLPARKTLNLLNVFAQDTIALGEKLRLTVGARMERNNYTGWEFEPNMRLAWKAGPDALLWTALSRAVRTPSRLDRELFSPGAAPFTALQGGPNFQSEKLTAFDVGYRNQLNSRVSYTVAAYWNRYDDLRSVESISTTAAPVVIANGMRGHASGVETWGNWQVLEGWRLSAGANFMHKSLGFEAGSRDVSGVQAAGNDPNHKVTLRSAMNFAPAMEFDANVRVMGALPSPAIPSYVALDLRWGWRVRPDVDVSVMAINVTQRRHVEFGTLAQRAEVPRSVAVKLAWRL